MHHGADHALPVARRAGSHAQCDRHDDDTRNHTATRRAGRRLATAVLTASRTGDLGDLETVLTAAA